MAIKLIAQEEGVELNFSDGNEWVIGRDPDECQLVVEDASASRKHVLAKRENGAITLTNLSETNPIKINDQEPEGPVPLSTGDTVVIGATTFTVVGETDESAEVTATPEPVENAAEEETEEEEFSEEEQEDEPASPTELTSSRDTIFDEQDEDEQVFEEINLDIAESGRWLLKVIAGPNNGAEFHMEAGQSYILGTEAAACDVIFHDLSVSRQHAKITIGQDESVSIEDLGSRNGIRIDEEEIKEPTTLDANTVVSLGTTVFMVIDREEERVTIIPPPLATLGKIVSEDAAQAAHAAVQSLPRKEDRSVESDKTHQPAGTFVMLAIITGLFVVMGLGISTLFQQQEITAESIDYESALEMALGSFPSVRYSYSPNTGQLLLLGHVLTTTDKSQILYDLQNLKFIRKIDDNIIIDELVWQETNQVVAKNSNWRAVSIQAPTPGRFVLTGYLKTRVEADKLSEYISLNFPYPELLENRVTVEEDVLSRINVLLQEAGMPEVSAGISNGEVTFNGFISYGRGPKMAAIVEQTQAIPGVRLVKNFVAEQQAESLMVDISDQYEVTGTSAIGKNISVVINGQILTVGDSLDGMKITKIERTNIQLERDGFKYKIEYNR